MGMPDQALHPAANLKAIDAVSQVFCACLMLSVQGASCHQLIIQLLSSPCGSPLFSLGM